MTKSSYANRTLQIGIARFRFSEYNEKLGVSVSFPNCGLPNFHGVDFLLGDYRDCIVEKTIRGIASLVNSGARIRGGRIRDCIGVFDDNPANLSKRLVSHPADTLIREDQPWVELLDPAVRDPTKHFRYDEIPWDPDREHNQNISP